MYGGPIPPSRPQTDCCMRCRQDVEADDLIAHAQEHERAQPESDVDLPSPSGIGHNGAGPGHLVRSATPLDSPAVEPSITTKEVTPRAT